MTKHSKSKKQKSVLDQQSQDESNKKHKENAIYKCSCGKQYGSLAAVHTHINTKHPQQKARYKSEIVNPFKKNRTTPQTVRTKDIKYHKVEAALMIEADKTVKLIFELQRKRGRDVKQILDMEESEEDQISESQVNFQTIFKDNQRHRLYNNIDQYINKKAQQLNISQAIAQTEKNVPQKYKTFKLQKFNLNMSHEISKHFTFEIAKDIEFYLTFIKTKEYFKCFWEDKKLKDYENKIQNQNDKSQLIKILNNYVQNWSYILK